MPHIHVLDQITIDKIAAGEVIERPASIVKELVENAIDAGSTSVTVEIKDGGISFIRIRGSAFAVPSGSVPFGLCHPKQFCLPQSFRSANTFHH